MSILLILLIILLSLVLYLVNALRKHYKYWQNLGIDCDEPSWIFGSFKGAVTERTFLDIIQDHYYKYKNKGPFAGFYWFYRPAVFVTDMALIKQILIKDFNKFSDRGLFVNEEDDPLSGHLFNLEGHKWRIMRSKLSPTFTSGKMKFMFPTVVKVAQQLELAFAKIVEKDSKVEIRDIVSRYTTDVIGTCAFGLECNSLTDPQAKFHVMSKRALLENHLGNFGVAFRFSFPKLAKRLRMRDTVHEIEDFFMGIVKDTVKYREDNQVKRNDFMNLLLELKNNKVMKTEGGEDFTNLSLKEVAAQAFIFLVAGSDTSSTTMSFALYELALNQDIQEKARQEVNRVLELHNQEFSYECMSELKYLEQIIQETLRLYCPLPALNRVALEDYVVPGHPNFVIKKDMPVVIPAISIHRDEQYFPNPDKFNPENFSADQVALRDSVLYLPFGEGPRNCIGSRFGKMQIIIGLALLLKNFKFCACQETLIPMKYDKENFMVTPDGNLYLKATKV
ncbi:probable cytochrome P450 6a21 [Calliphora vicina]|uniref:probable cytochrome P450 6a21 n=1 Tax=Calliphora vicina TaxID=7373 RepID=UPI00325BEFA8